MSCTNIQYRLIKQYLISADTQYGTDILYIPNCNCRSKLEIHIFELHVKFPLIWITVLT